jgi:hypothetical protein
MITQETSPFFETVWAFSSVEFLVNTDAYLAIIAWKMAAMVNMRDQVTNLLMSHPEGLTDGIHPKKYLYIICLYCLCGFVSKNEEVSNSSYIAPSMFFASHDEISFRRRFHDKGGSTCFELPNAGQSSQFRSVGKWWYFVYTCGGRGNYNYFYFYDSQMVYVFFTRPLV